MIFLLYKYCRAHCICSWQYLQFFCRTQNYKNKYCFSGKDQIYFMGNIFSI